MWSLLGLEEDLQVVCWGGVPVAAGRTTRGRQKTKFTLAEFDREKVNFFLINWLTALMLKRRVMLEMMLPLCPL